MKKQLLTIALAMSVSACNLIDSATINQQAAQSYRATVSQAQTQKLVDNTSNTSRRVQKIFRKLVPFATQANQTGQPFIWEMTVIRSDELNAWAMPGGKMVVYTGIVEQLNLTDDEIAAIIGHEMTHALLEHSAKEANRSAWTNLGANIGANVLTAVTGVDGNLIGTGVGLAADLGISKPFSRSAETEADFGGLKLMAQAGYNPQAAISVWQKMNQSNDNNNVATKILSTHPTNNDRIAAIQRNLPNVMPIYQRAKMGQ